MVKVYLSATRLDLADECATVKAWLTDAGHEPVDSYVPDSQPVLKSCLADIDGCDIYVLILGYRYGFRPPEENPENLSITQLEFRHAGKRGIPRLVLHRSSIPNVELSDIFDPAEIGAVNDFHREVGKEVRPARFASNDELINQLRAGIFSELKKLGLSPGATTLIEPLRRASRDLLTWPSTLPGDKWLERQELDLLRQRIAESSDSVTLVLGEPGCGKSALLARLGQFIQADGIPVLGIKADFLPEYVLTHQTLMQYLELPIPVLSAVESLAEEGPVLVLLDQLDALADLVVQHSARLRVLLNLIRDLKGIPNVHVVATCRPFEQRHDPSLRNLEADLLTLTLPSMESVDTVLQSQGVHTGSWAEEMREALRSPHALDTFLSLLGGTDELSLLRSYRGMLEVQWKRSVLCDASGDRKALMFDIARQMAEREMLWLPLALFEDRLALAEELVAAGLLRVEEGVGRIGFRHQTLYEFIRARSFLNAQGSLTDTVLAGQNSLRIRPQFWHALGYLRDVAPDIYQEELWRLWASELRPHLRMMIIEFLGRQATPLGSEARLALQNFDDPWFQRRFLNVVVGSPGWFALLMQTHLPMLMNRPVQEAAIVQLILGQAINFSSQEVMALIDKHWLPYPSLDELSWQVLVMGVVPPPDAAWVQRLETILSRTNLSSWVVGHAVGIVSAVQPNDAPRLLASWLAQQWHRIQRENTGAISTNSSQGYWQRCIAALRGTRLVSYLEEKLLSPLFTYRAQSSQGTVTVETEEYVSSSSQRSRATEDLMRCRDLHDLTVIAEAAPHAFIQALWPLFLEMLETVSSEAHPFVVGYRDCHVLLDGLDDEDETSLEHPLPEAITLAIDAWAEAEPEAFLEFVRANATVDMLQVQRWLARGLVKCVSYDPAFVLEFLCADPRRFALGPYSNHYRDSNKLITAVAPHLDEKQYQQLEAQLLNWHHYSQVPDDDVQTRKRRMMWDRQNRLRLLRALPTERLSQFVRRLIAEEERAFPEVSDRDIWFSGAQWIGSPVSAEQMLKGSDEDVVHLFEELTDDHAWDHPQQSMKGGAIQAGRELARLAETDVERAVRLMRQLQPGRNETPVGEVMRNLVKTGFGREALYALIEELSTKGFSSDQFRQAAAHAIEEATNTTSPVPESLLVLLESWLVSVDPASEDVAGEQSAQERKQSLLWGHGGFFVLPSGNYPILAAISRSCLVDQPPRTDRWLDILERHLRHSESPRVWTAVAGHYFRWLNLATHERAQSFLNRIFHAYPSILGKLEGVRLLAYLQHWIAPENAKRWLQLMVQAGNGGKQGYGELLMLRHAMFPAEDWTRGQVTALLHSSSAETREQRAGIAYSLVNLWSELEHRNLANGYLLPLLGSGEEDVLHALGGIFLNQSWFPDQSTRLLLDALYEHPAILRNQQAEFLGEHLEDLVEIEPERVARLANALLDQVGEAMRSISTSWYLRSESLLAVALSLQDMGEPHRSIGVALFERMLEFNLPQAHEMVLSMDKRTPQGTSAPSVRRRKRVRSRKT